MNAIDMKSIKPSEMAQNDLKQITSTRKKIQLIGKDYIADKMNTYQFEADGKVHQVQIDDKYVIELFAKGIEDPEQEYDKGSKVPFDFIDI